MRFEIKNKLLYFCSGVIVGYILGCTTLMIMLIILTSLALIHRSKISSFYSKIKKMILPLFNNQIRAMSIFEETPLLSNRKKIEAFVTSDITEKINEYCQWANIKDIGVFIEKSARLIFEKDKDWKAHQRAIKITLRPQAKARSQTRKTITSIQQSTEQK